MERLQIVRDEKVVPWPWGKDTPALSSVTQPWRGFQLEHHCSREPPEYVSYASWPAMQVALVTSGRIMTSYRTGLREHHHLVRPGGIFIYPGGYEMTRVQPSGAFEAILAQLDGPLINRLLPTRDTLDTHAISPQHNIVDEHLASLLRAMQDEVQAGCPTGGLYAESLSLALASYIASRFAVQASEAWHDNGQLSMHQIQRLIDFIEGRLESELSLTELASVIRLSPRHFARLFKKTFGLSPHQYVMRERVRQAKRLLTERKSPISEIALSLGFGNQSYFTYIFHRVTGITPKRYRREH